MSEHFGRHPSIFLEPSPAAESVEDEFEYREVAKAEEKDLSFLDALLRIWTIVLVGIGEVRHGV